MTTELLSFTWRERQHPLVPECAAGLGPAARALAQRLLAMEDEQLTRLTGVAGPDLLLAMGDVPDLPWVDGVKYLGRDARARELLLPTAVEPSLPLELVHRAFALEFSDAARIAIIDDPPLVVPVGAARELARAEINRWLAGVS